MNKQLTVLVVDDSNLARMMVNHFITKLGHIPILAQSGEEAVDLFTIHAPDLILLDVQMPGLGGYEAARLIRERAGATWVPIIFLSASAGDDDKIKGLEMGGDDYLAKPVSFPLLAAKIKVMQRIAEMQRALRDNAEQLARYRDDNEREQRLATHLMNQLVRTDAFVGEGVEKWVMPAQHFSGDLLVAAYAPSGAIHVILADGTGHGLSAALSVIPVTEVFYSMTERGFSISRIARELNRKIKALMPTGRFVAATLAAIHCEERTIEIWNGGNPTALFVCNYGSIRRSWPSMHPALGILRPEEFSEHTEVFRWIESGHLYMCSDGLLEAENPVGEAFGSEHMEQIIFTASPESRFGCLRAAVQEHLGSKPAHDDVSLVAIDCPGAWRSQVRSTGNRTPKEGDPVRSCAKWRLALRLSAAELKTMDVLPFLMGWVEQVQVEQMHRSQIFLILAELFNNALDHGLLKLDSQLKASADDGFERYIAERAMNLEALDYGSIEIELEPLWQFESNFLQLRVKDSGNGFDHVAALQTDIAQSEKRSGRGIALIQGLGAKITYLGNGNEVVVLYQLT